MAIYIVETYSWNFRGQMITSVPESRQYRLAPEFRNGAILHRLQYAVLHIICNFKLYNLRKIASVFGWICHALDLWDLRLLTTRA